MPVQATANYTANNTLQTKQIIIVVSIAGVSDVFTSIPSAPTDGATYGDGHSYGDAGLLYGNMFSTVFAAGGFVRDYLSLNGSSLSISQKVEPEQGRASVSQFTLAFIDKDSYMTQLFSPGIIIPDIMGAEVKVYLGYVGLSYPSDFLTVFRGYVSGVSSQAGLATIQLSDPNIKRRQQLFSAYTTTLSSNIDNSTTTIPVTDVSGLYASIFGPTNTTGSTVTYIQIDDEIMQYDSTAFSGNTIMGASRHSLGTTAAAHTAGASVSMIVELNGRAIDLALQIMLSGWDSAWTSGIDIKNIGVVDGVGVSANKIQMPDGVDMSSDYGLVEGDWIDITGATNAGNNGHFQIVAIQSVGGFTNNVMILKTSLGASPAFASEPGTPAVGALRSQFDVLPMDCGMKLTPKDVDVAGHLLLQQTWANSTDYTYRFRITDVESSGKSFLESQIYLPIGCYSLTKRGLLSVGITRPPVGGAAIATLTPDNILFPENIRETRALNNRKFFNQIQFQYNVSLAGVYGTTFITFDNTSLNQIGFLTTLPITSNGGTDTTANVFETQANLLLTRYARGAQQIDLTVNYGIGNLIEAGDLVVLSDDGTLQIANYATGTRNIGTQYFEVENRTLDLKTGNVKLTLVSGIAAQTTDRFGIISPSSILAGTQTASQITISDSYGAVFPSNEPKKWQPYLGQLVTIHNADWSISGTTTLVSQDPTNAYIMNLSPPLGFTPAAGYIVDVPYYPTSADPLASAQYKNTFAFADPQLVVTGGSSATVFTVSSGDAAKLFAGSIILVHNSSFSVLSGEVVVLSVVGTTVTTKTTLGFTPAAGYLVELVGFSYDQGAAYRML